MSEAAKLFNSKGGASNGDKQDVVNSAAKVRRTTLLSPARRASLTERSRQTMMKLMLKNKVSGTMGAGSEGGMGGLLCMLASLLVHRLAKADAAVGLPQRWRQSSCRASHSSHSARLSHTTYTIFPDELQSHLERNTTHFRSSAVWHALFDEGDPLAPATSPASSLPDMLIAQLSFFAAALDRRNVAPATQRERAGEADPSHPLAFRAMRSSLIAPSVQMLRCRRRTRIVC